MVEFNPSPVEWLFWDALALIAMACVFAPLFRKAGLGTVLGYLAAGLAVQLIFAGRLTEHPEELLHFAEFGVVLFLFVIGLELKPSTLWAMRGDIFGLGLTQVLVCGAVLALPAWALMPDLSLEAAVIVGLGLALSSTALVMQVLDERRERGGRYGRKAFAVLLFQDLAIVPLLLLVAFLAPAIEDAATRNSFAQLGLALAAIAGLVLAGRFLLDPMFRLLARARMPEIMTASALGVVIAASLLMDLVGMSYGMGAFIAGVMLAESAYRHEIEADIEPFRGLFLGLFFMAVGLSLDLDTVAANWPTILLGAAGVMGLKALTLYGLGRSFRLAHDDAVRFALALPQAGEFGFVLFASATSAALLDVQSASILVAMVSVTMALSPLASRLEALLIRQKPVTLEDTLHEAKGRTLIIGFGRFGQVVSQPLFANGVDVTILDHNADRTLEARRFGFQVHFGDGARRDVLRAAGAARAEMIVVCIDDVEATGRIVDLVNADFPQAQLFVRSYDRRHSIVLAKTRVDYSVRETFESALKMGEKVLIGLGAEKDAACDIIKDIRRRDLERLQAQIEGDLRSGGDRLHTQPVRPEPLPRKG